MRLNETIAYREMRCPFCCFEHTEEVIIKRHVVVCGLVHREEVR